MSAGVHSGSGELAGDRLVHLARADLAVSELDGAVSVALGGADTRHHVGAGLDDRHRDDFVVLIEHLRHAQLGAQNAFSSHFFGISYWDYWMLTSTLAGRSMRMSASTVFGVGSRMSIRRL